MNFILCVGHQVGSSSNVFLFCPDGGASVTQGRWPAVVTTKTPEATSSSSSNVKPFQAEATGNVGKLSYVLEDAWENWKNTLVSIGNHTQVNLV